MNNDRTTQLAKNSIGPDTELYGRCRGQFTKRLGFLGDVSSPVYINIQNNHPVQALSAISQAIEQLPVELHRRTLTQTYKTVIDKYRNLQANTLGGSYERLFDYCENKSNGFQVGLDDQLTYINPKEYCWKPSFAQKLSGLETVCDAYVVVLWIYLRSAIKLSSGSLSDEDPILDQIKSAYNSLKTKLRETLTPGGVIENSLLLDSLVKKDSDRFEIYLEYDGRYLGASGVKDLMHLANAADRHDDRVILEKPGLGVDSYERALADKLVELMRSFEALHELRVSYSFSNKSSDQTVSLPDSIE